MSPIGIARDVAVISGAGLVSYGAWLAWRPAGFIVAGLFLFVTGASGALRASATGKEPAE